jgi:hypothetical protein
MLFEVRERPLGVTTLIHWLWVNSEAVNSVSNKSSMAKVGENTSKLASTSFPTSPSPEEIVGLSGEGLESLWRGIEEPVEVMGT